MSDQTHGYCPNCREDSAIGRNGWCLWCDAPTRKRRGGGKPAGVYGKLSDSQLRALHRMHHELGMTVRELGRHIWRQSGYASAKSATTAILGGWKRLALRALSQGEATALANRLRRSEDSPGTADRAAYKRWRRRRDGGYRRCRGVKLQAPGRGAPCTRYALVDSDYCFVHDPAHRREVVAHTAAMREQIGKAA